jgi:hypothetical protein
MVKYATNTKSTRNRELFDYKNQHPEESWRDVGSIFGVSRQRAQEIYQNELKRRKEKNAEKVTQKT